MLYPKAVYCLLQRDRDPRRGVADSQARAMTDHRVLFSFADVVVIVEGHAQAEALPGGWPDAAGQPEARHVSTQRGAGNPHPRFGHQPYRGGGGKCQTVRSGNGPGVRAAASRRRPGPVHDAAIRAL